MATPLHPYTTRKRLERKKMGLYERMVQENMERGIVPRATQQHSKWLICEKCGEQIDPLHQGWEGRYMSEAEAKANNRPRHIPVYAHVECPEDDPEISEIP